MMMNIVRFAAMFVDADAIGLHEQNADFASFGAKFAKSALKSHIMLSLIELSH